MIRVLSFFWIVSSLAFAVTGPSADQLARGKVLKAIRLHSTPGLRLDVDRVLISRSIPDACKVNAVRPQPPLGLVNFEFSCPNGSIFASAVVRGFQKIAIAKTNIRNGEAFNNQNVAFEEREVTDLGMRGYFPDENSLSSLRAQGFLRAGSVITAANAQTPLAVTFGQNLELLHERKSVSLRVQVKALESGRLNDWIRVENPTTKKVILARITAPSEVQTR